MVTEEEENKVILPEKPEYFRVDYSRCIHLLKRNLKKRCEFYYLSFTENESGNIFSISNSLTSLNFTVNSAENSLLINDLIEITNDCLLSFYDPSLLFTVISSLQNIHNVTGLNIRVVKNELVIPFDGLPVSFTDAFQLIFSELDTLSIPFYFQLMPDAYISINRCLKVLPHCLLQISDFFESIIELVNLYSKCFPSKPVVCRMQSLSPSSEICHLDEITPFHLSENQSSYLEISRLLYPQIQGCPDNLLTKKYLQIVPVNIIIRRKPLKIFEMLHNFCEMGAAVVPLSGGNFRLANYFDLNMDTLLQLSASNRFLEFLTTLINMNINPELFIKIYDLRFYDRRHPWEYKKIISLSFDQFFDFCDKLKDDKNVIIIGDEKVITYFPCKECVSPTTEKTVVVVNDGFGFNLHMLIQIIRENDNFVNAFRKFVVVADTDNVGEEEDVLCIPMFFYHKDIIEHYTYKDFIPSNRCYRFINDEKFLLVDKRFTIDKNIINDTESGNLFLHIVDLLIQLENEEGLLLTFNAGEIRIVENMNPLDEYERDSINDIQSAINIFKKQKFKDIEFEITQERKFLCNGVCLIAANLLTKFRNFDLLFDIVMAVCQLLPKKRQQCMKANDVLNDSYYSKRVAQKAEDIAALKSLLQLWNLELCKIDGDLLMENFLNVPHFVEKYVYHLKDLFQTLRDLKISFDYCVENDVLTIGYYCRFHTFDLKSLKKNFFCQLPHLFLLLEKIVVEDNNHIHVTPHGAFVSTENSNLYMRNPYETSNLSSRPTNAENQKELLECFKIFKDELKDDTIKARVFLNGVLELNNICIWPSTFLSIQRQSRGDFFEAVIIYSNLVQSAFARPPPWLTFSAETSDSKNHFKKSGGFSIVDDNIGVYIKLVKLLQRNIETIPDDMIYSTENVELLPSNFIMKNPERLLDLLEKLKLAGCDITINNADMLCADSISLTTKKFLKIADVDKFAQANDILCKLPPENINEEHKNLDPLLINMPKETILSDDSYYYLNSSGFLSSESFEDKVEPLIVFSSINVKEEYKRFIADYIGKWHKFLMHSNSKLTITLNSNVYIMIGNFIWSTYDVFAPMNGKDILEICETFDQAFNERHDAMQSIFDIKNFDAAKHLAKELNEMLQYIPDEIFRSEYFQIIPKRLKERLIADSEATTSVLNALIGRMKSENIHWILTLNGHIEIESCITLTIDHLLNITNYDEFFQLVSFCKPQNNEEYEKVICEEEIFFDKYEAQKGFDRQESKEMFQTFQDLKNSFPFSRIEPDLTILFDKRLWVRPNEYKKNEKKVKELNSKLKQIFGENSNYRFQYGANNQRVMTTLGTTNDEVLYNYCRNFCSLIKEVDSSIDIKYIVDNHRNTPRHLFRFNNEINIHPRSFFHMKNVESFISAMNYYSTSNDDVEKKRITFLKRIAEIKGEEKFEFESLKQFVLKELGKVFIKDVYEDYIKSHLLFVYNTVTDDEENYYNVGKIKMNGYEIFSTGNFNSLIDSMPKLVFFPEHIFIALRLASDMNPELNFKNISHLVSLINATKHYCDGKRPINEKLIITNSKITIENIWESEEEYEKVLNIFKTELLMIKNKLENSQYFYQFPSLSSNLHHWFKHGQDFDSFGDYYIKMNEFFKVCKNYIEEIDTQEGISFMKGFSNQKYVGVIIEEIDKSNEELQKINHSGKTVLTFYKDSGKKEEKQKAKAAKKEEIKNMPYTFFKFNEKFVENNLLITEKSIFNYRGERIQNAGVFLVEKDITHLTNLLRTYTFKDENSVERVLLLLNEKYQFKKLKNESEMEKGLENLLEKLLKAFKGAIIFIFKTPEASVKSTKNVIVSNDRINALLKSLIAKNDPRRLKYLNENLVDANSSDETFKVFIDKTFSKNNI